MTVNGADVAVEVVEETLCFSEGIGLQYEVFAAGLAFAPIIVNFGKDVLLFPPMKNGEGEGTFGVKYATFYGFEWG